MSALAEGPQRLWIPSQSEQPRVGHSAAETRRKAVDPRTAFVSRKDPKIFALLLTAYACKQSSTSVPPESHQLASHLTGIDCSPNYQQTTWLWYQWHMRWRTYRASKCMYSFMCLLVQTESETSFKNNQYRGPAQHSNANKLVYVTGTPLLSKHWLCIVVELRRTSIWKKCMKILFSSLEKGNVLGETQTHNISANIYWVWALTVING